ncbi:extracellular solute-binding protein [Paenibacillus sp. TRM 82003]|uniref:ABC transporter substrate-binding protein n=1 Tax=Kineococcus sp. TRM81007 TaxID=2925831 RepID=UPI001F57DEE5|nr:extracellular solute-binding protein [Kineococcus sp. TRM81007]MCI2238137.1 extracellular solute-binding protein [Kineococcus sp. TRM81007]MCI3920521.1 extracellular solute-binding protein [Paenibacillus sp. TRM 82003]
MTPSTTPGTSTTTRRLLSRRAFTAGLAGTAATTALAGCGGGSETAEGNASLRFTWWGSDTRHEITDRAIKAFQAEHPDIAVQGEFTEWSGYWDRLATNVAANDAPDVIQMDVLQLRSYADRGALLDLADTEIDTSGIPSDTLSTGRTADGLFAVPVGVNAHVVVANPALFEAAGVPLPDDTTWTWQEAADIALRISQSGQPDVHGWQTMGLDEASLQLWVSQLGGEFYGDGTEVTLDPAHVASWWQYNLDTIQSGAAAPATLAVERQAAGLSQSGTATGTAAMAVWWANQVTALSSAAGQEMVLLRPPLQEAGGSPGLFYKASMFWSISSRSENPEAAATLVDWLSNSPEAAEILLTERGIPSDPELRDQITSLLQPSDAQSAEYVESLEDVVVPAPPAAPPGASTVQDLVTRYGSEVLFGAQTPQAAAEAMVAELQANVASA